MSQVVCGSCPQCGAPIYTESPWWGITPPSSKKSCFCRSTYPSPVVTTSTNTIPLHESLQEMIAKEVRKQLAEIIDSQYDEKRTS